MFTNEITIRPFRDINDVIFASSLTHIVEWHSETKNELLSYFDYDMNSCFLAELNGEKAGFCIATAYQKNGFIGDLIVSPTYRNQGIGKLLVQAAISFLKDKKIDRIFLDSVTEAVPLYKRIGFREVCRSLRFFGGIEPETNPHVSKISQNDFEQICAIDKIFFGDDRSFFLQRRLVNYPQLCLKLVNDGKIQAYLFGREGEGGWIHVGPIVSLLDSHETFPILRAFQEIIGYQPFSIGVLETQREMVINLIQAGVKPNPEPPIRMILGEGQNLGSGPNCFAIGSPAKG
ncbi:MAG: GNAT family N-acetyltransferase [Anaerolineaceae bacterium]